MSPAPLLHLICVVAAFGFSFAAPCGAREWIVAPNGKADAEGTADAPIGSLAEAAGRANAGDVIRLAGGVYTETKTIRLKRNGTGADPIRVEPLGEARPVFDFSAQEFSSRRNGISVDGDYWHLVGLEVTGAARNGIRIGGNHNIVERCVTHANQDSGIEISPPGSHNLVLDCDSYRNVDRPTAGENADGFAAKFAIGPGNVFRGCRAWENADDGFDLWKAPEPVRLERCLAFRNGIDLWNIEGYTGNGNGFKLGGDYIAAAHVVIDCVAMDQPHRGFDQNNNMGALTIERCTALRCGTGFDLTKTPATGQPHVLRYNLSWDAPARLVEGTVETQNRWTNADGTPAPTQITPPTPPRKPTRNR